MNNVYGPKLTFFKTFFQEHNRVFNGLGPNCLQILAADDFQKSPLARKELKQRTAIVSVRKNISTHKVKQQTSHKQAYLCMLINLENIPNFK